ncbi:MAG: hypothetical protein JJT94_00665 [Bernardetiaceae bacterium]|nr:hypothetical protein [Bernardetiaceae bacterium]
MEELTNEQKIAIVASCKSQEDIEKAQEKYKIDADTFEQWALLYAQSKRSEIAVLNQEFKTAQEKNEALDKAIEELQAEILALELENLKQEEELERLKKKAADNEQSKQL